VISLLDRTRQGTLPKPPLDVPALVSSGIPESLGPRTVSSLKLLELIDGAGNPTDALLGFGRCATDEFKPSVVAWLREVYGDVFQIVGEPEAATFKQVEDAFRHYTPTGQWKRMVALFIALCDYAELLPENSPLRATSRAVAARNTSPPKKPRQPRYQPRAEPERARAVNQRDRPEPEPQQSPPMSKAELMDGLKTPGAHPLVTGMFQMLPAAGATWPTAKREAWLSAARGIFEVLYELPEGDAGEVKTP
jgi:hypothetical protein